MLKLKNETERKNLTRIDEKLYITRFRPDTGSHIKTSPHICAVCKGKECTKFCPSNVFAWSEINDRLIVAYENCLECGACTIGCPYEAIEYRHPKAGYGLF